MAMMSNDNKKGEQLEILTSTSETHTAAGDNDDNDDNDDNNADDPNDTNDGNVANDREDNCNQEQLQNKFDEIPMKDSESTVDATDKDAVGSENDSKSMKTNGNGNVNAISKSTDITDTNMTIVNEPPKRSRTAYFIFMASKRSDVQAQNPKATIGSIAKILGKQWKHLDPDQKQVYMDQATQEKIKYQHLLQLYQEQHPNTNATAKRALQDQQSSHQLGVEEGVLSFPLARIRKICKLDPEVKGISKEAAMLVTKAAELFTTRLGQETFQMAQMQKRRKLMTQDVVDVTQLKETFHFLKDDLGDLSKRQQDVLKAGSDDRSSGNGDGNKGIIVKKSKELSVKAAAAVANTKPMTSFFAKK